MPMSAFWDDWRTVMTAESILLTADDEDDVDYDSENGVEAQDAWILAGGGT